MTCAGVFLGHDSRLPVGTYRLRTSAGIRSVQVCQGCARAMTETGLDLLPDRRAVPRSGTRWIGRAKDLTPWCEKRG